MAFRFDRGQPFKAKKTTEGFLVADGMPTRAGIFIYRRADGSEIRELRSPDEVFAPNSLASLAAATLTFGHPTEPVSADNSVGLSVGHLGETITHDSKNVIAKVYVKDAKAVAAVMAGSQQELSCGYTCDVDETPGTYQGERYDTVQRNIRYNHVALVRTGRAGPENRIRLDSNDAVEIETTPKECTVHKIKIDGVDYEVSESVQQAVNQSAEKRDAEVAKLQAKADSLQGELQKAQAELQVARDPKAIASAVEAKLTLVKVADRASVKCDGMDDEAIRKAVVAKVKPGITLDGKSAAYVEAMFDIASQELAAKDVADLRKDSVEAIQNTTEGPTPEQRMVKARQDQADAWKLPLTANKESK